MSESPMYPANLPTGPAHSPEEVAKMKENVRRHTDASKPMGRLLSQMVDFLRVQADN